MENNHKPNFVWLCLPYIFCAGMLLGCLIFPRPLEKNPWPVMAECLYYMAFGALLLKVWQKGAFHAPSQLPVAK